MTGYYEDDESDNAQRDYCVENGIPYRGYPSDYDPPGVEIGTVEPLYGIGASPNYKPKSSSTHVPKVSVGCNSPTHVPKVSVGCNSPTYTQTYVPTYNPQMCNVAPNHHIEYGTTIFESEYVVYTLVRQLRIAETGEVVHAGQLIRDVRSTANGCMFSIFNHQTMAWCVYRTLDPIVVANRQIGTF
jgi:hypothetical protein